MDTTIKEESVCKPYHIDIQVMYGKARVTFKDKDGVVIDDGSLTSVFEQVKKMCEGKITRSTTEKEIEQLGSEIYNELNTSGGCLGLQIGLLLA